MCPSSHFYDIGEVDALDRICEVHIYYENQASPTVHIGSNEKLMELMYETLMGLQSRNLRAQSQLYALRDNVFRDTPTSQLAQSLARRLYRRPFNYFLANTRRVRTHSSFTTFSHPRRPSCHLHQGSNRHPSTRYLSTSNFNQVLLCILRRYILVNRLLYNFHQHRLPIVHRRRH